MDSATLKDSTSPELFTSMRLLRSLRLDSLSFTTQSIPTDIQSLSKVIANRNSQSSILSHVPQFLIPVNFKGPFLRQYS